MKERPEELPRVVNRGPRGYWHRAWCPEKNHPRGGRDRWTFLGRDPDDARRRYHELEAELPAKPDRDGAMASVASAWLATYVKTTRNEKGQTLAEIRVRTYLVPHLGRVHVQKLTSDDLLLYRQRLQGVKSKHTGRKLARQTVRHIPADLKCMLLWAGVRRGVIPRKYIPKGPKRAPRALTPEEQRAVRAIEDPFGLMCRIMLDSGARWSEACALTRDDLIDGELRFYTHKGEKERLVPIPAGLVAELKARVGRFTRFESKDDPWFNRAVRLRSGVESFSAHRCRHSFGFNYMADGGNLLVLKELMGHSTIELTAVYAMPTQSLVRQDAAKVHAKRAG